MNDTNTEEYCFKDHGLTFSQITDMIEMMGDFEVPGFRFTEFDYLLEGGEGKIIPVDVDINKVAEGRYEFEIESSDESALFTIWVDDDGSMSISGRVSEPLYRFVSMTQKDENGNPIVDLEGFNKQFN